MTSQLTGKIDSQKKALLIMSAIIVSLVALSIICFLAYVGFLVIGFVLKVVLGILLGIAILALIIYVIVKIKKKKNRRSTPTTTLR